MIRKTPTWAAALLTLVLVAGCGAESSERTSDRRLSSERSEHLDSKASVAESSVSTRPRSLRHGAGAPAQDIASACSTSGCAGTLTEPATGLGSKPPAWLGTRELPKTSSGYGEVRPTPPALRHRRWTLPDTVPMLPGTGYAAKVVSPAPQRVIARSSWVDGCPVAATDLAWIRLTFWGFDAQRHTGELLVHRTVADDIVGVFRTLYRQRFPQEQVVVVRSYDPDAAATGDGNGTGSFVCRPSTGASYFSQHAYGLAIDVNTFQNPYAKGDVVLPELASSYLRRDAIRPGMIVPAGPVIDAFARIGWEWGGAWNQSKDYQHFSQNGL